MTGIPCFDPASLSLILEALGRGDGAGVLCVLPSSRHVDSLRDHLVQAPCPVGGGRPALVTFSGLVDRVLAAAGRERPVVNGATKRLLVGSVAKALAAEGKLAYFAKLAGFPGLARSLAQVIGRIKLAGVTPDALTALCAGHSGSEMESRRHDIALVYQAYQALLAERGLTDFEERYSEALAALDGTGQPLQPYNRVFVDGFFELAPAQAALLRSLGNRAATFRFSLPRLPGVESANRCEAIGQLLSPLEVYRYEPPEVGSGARHDGLRFLAAPSEEYELRLVAREIKGLAESGIRLYDMAVAVPDSSYSARAVEVFREEGVPCDLPWTSPLDANPALQALLALLDQLTKARRGFDLLRLARSDYLWSDRETAATLREVWPQNGYVYTSRRWRADLAAARERTRWRVERASSVESPDDDDSTRRAGEEARLARLDSATGQLESFLDTFDAFPQNATPTEFAGAIERLLAELQFVERCLDPCLPEDLRCRDWSALVALQSVLTDLKNQAGLTGTDREQVTLTEFVRDFRAALSDYTLRLAPGAPGGVAVVPVDKIAGLAFPVVFVVGLVDGRFPLHETQDWLWDDELRRDLRRAGFAVDLRSDASGLEHFRFSAVTAASGRRLYLSLPESDAGGVPNVASPFWEEARRAAGEPLVGRLTIVEALVARAQRVRGSSRFAGGAVTLLPPAGEITDQEALAVLATKYGGSFRWSVTALGDYGKCPFRYFAGRELGLAAPQVLGEDLTPQERGSVLHAILREFHTRHLGEDLRAADPTTLRAELRRIADEHLERSNGGELAAHPLLWERRKERLITNLLAVLDNDLRLVAESGGTLRPSYLEWSFGGRATKENDPRSTSEPLVLTEGDSRLCFSGVIDRIDMTPGGEFMVYDYKLKTVPEYKEMELGTNLQLPVYISAVRALLLPRGRAVGGAFYPLSNPRAAKGIYHKERTDLIGGVTQRNGVFGDSEWEAKAGEFQHTLFAQSAAIKSGRFQPAPATAEVCKYCDFKVTCRVGEIEAVSENG